MNDELITFETAKLAKEKGFDIPCNKMFTYGKEMFGYVNVVKEYDGSKYECTEIPHDWNNTKQPTSTKYFSRPTQSLLQRWLREVHNIHVEIKLLDFVDLSSEYHCKVTFIKDDLWGWFIPTKNKSKLTYEEAIEIGIQEGLKLIKDE